MSAAWPSNRPRGWCMTIREWGSAERFPRVPEHNRNWPMEAARPRHEVATSQLTNCMVS